MALPRAKSVKQLKRFKRLTGSDIGDKTAKMGAGSANLGHVSSATSRKITDYEGYIKNKEGHKKMSKPREIKTLNEYLDQHNDLIKTNEDLNLNLQEFPSTKEDKAKLRNFSGGYVGPDEEPSGDSLFGDTRPKEIKNQANRTLDLFRLGKHVTIGKEDYFIDKLEGAKVTLRNRIGGDYLEMSVKDFLKKSKSDDGHFTITNESTDELFGEEYNDIIKFKDFKSNENMLPKPSQKIKCQECGEDVCDDWKYKIGHVQNKHFIKPTTNDDLIKNAIKTCFP